MGIGTLYLLAVDYLPVNSTVLWMGTLNETSGLQNWIWYSSLFMFFVALLVAFNDFTYFCEDSGTVGAIITVGMIVIFVLSMFWPIVILASWILPFTPIIIKCCKE